MMLRVATLASGSSGNSLVVSDGYEHILIDAGISAKRIMAGLKELQIDPAQISAVLITHEHNDHISGLSVLCRQIKTDIYTAEKTAEEICKHMHNEIQDRFCVFYPGEYFTVGKFTVGTFPVSHDCVSPVGLTVRKDNMKMALCTDLGIVTQDVLHHIRGAGLLLVEFNYDPEMLRNGSYPPWLKKRISGKQGHLPNGEGGKLAAWAIQQGAKKIVLCHLSKENNTPDKALKAAEEAVNLISRQIKYEPVITVAPRESGSGWMEVPEC